MAHVQGSRGVREHGQGEKRRLVGTLVGRVQLLLLPLGLPALFQFRRLVSTG